MKSLPVIALAAIALLSPGPAAAEEGEYYPELITLIAELANLGVMGNRCETRLINFGKDALNSDECAGFTKRYYEHWPDRAALQQEILEFAKRSERGEFDCDARCRSMLMRCEELRIGVTYVLDYIDFVKEM